MTKYIKFLPQHKEQQMKAHFVTNARLKVTLCHKHTWSYLVLTMKRNGESPWDVRGTKRQPPL